MPNAPARPDPLTRALGLLAYVLAFTLVGVSFLITALALAARWREHEWAMALWRTAVFWLDDNARRRWMADLPSYSYTPVIGALAIFALARLVERWAALRRVVTAEEVKEGDKRPPVLFLRSDRDDGMMLDQGRPRGGLTWMLDDLDTVEEAVEREVSMIGPMIALAGAGEKRAVVGAARKQPEESTWRQEITGEMDRARVIIWSVGLTPGVVWELEELHRRGLLRKTILVFPPLRGVARSTRTAGLLLLLARIDAAAGKARFGALRQKLVAGESTPQEEPPAAGDETNEALRERLMGALEWPDDLAMRAQAAALVQLADAGEARGSGVGPSQAELAFARTIVAAQTTHELRAAVREARLPRNLLAARAVSKDAAIACGGPPFIALAIREMVEAPLDDREEG